MYTIVLVGDDERGPANLGKVFVRLAEVGARSPAAGNPLWLRGVLWRA